MGCVVGRGQRSQKSAGNDSDPSKQTFRQRNACVAPTLERFPRSACRKEIVSTTANGEVSSPSGLSRGLHHGFLHAVFACPIQADLVAIGIIEISMQPAPRHHTGQLGDVEACFLELPAEVVEIPDFEVQAHTFARNGNRRTSLMQRDGSIATRRAQTRIHLRTFIAEVFNELESKQITVETNSAIHVFNVDHGVVEGKLSFGIYGGGNLFPSRSGLPGRRSLCRARIPSFFRGGFSCCWFLHRDIAYVWRR